MKLTRLQIRMLIGCVIGACLSFPTIVVAIFGQLVLPLAEGLHRTKAEIGLAYSVMSLVGMGMPPLVGALIDRFGVRTVTGASAFSMALVLFALSNVHSYSWFLILYCLLAITGAGTLPLAYSRPIVTAFKSNLGLILGIMLAFTGVATALNPLLVVRMVEMFDFRAAYLALAAAAAVGGCAALLIPNNRAAAQENAGASPLKGALGEARKLTGFKMIAIAVMLGVFTAGVWSQVVPILSAKGISPYVAANTMAGVAVTLAITRFLGGCLLDYIFAPFVALGILIPVMIAWLSIAYSGDHTVIIVSTLILGMGLGIEIDLFSYLTSKYVPHRLYSSFYGLLFSGMALGGAITAPLAGIAKGLVGGEHGTPILMAVVLMMALAIMLTLPRYALGKHGAPAEEAMAPG